ncbi:MAG: SoxR reducing system RseC family protein [Christensenellales bacterium]|jgi:sigma-E factor negative regulatory protein RseC|nr:SoxR reducing system RseC family protein [Clostridiales bacterium]
MTEIGTISKIDKKNRATVRFPRKTACENCRMCLKPKDEMYVELLVKNTLGAKVGDKVSVSMGKQIVLISSIIVYLLPVVLVAAALFFTRSMKEILSFGISMGILIISYVIIAFIDKWIKSNKNYIPKMVAILKEEDNQNGK